MFFVRLVLFIVVQIHVSNRRHLVVRQQWWVGVDVMRQRHRQSRRGCSQGIAVPKANNHTLQCATIASARGGGRANWSTDHGWMDGHKHGQKKKTKKEMHIRMQLPKSILNEV